MRRYIAILVALMVFVLFVSACGGNSANAPTAPEIQPIIKITDITDKSEADVTKALGDPISKTDGTWRYSGTSKQVANSPTITYKNGIEIKFIEGKAARITITPQTSTDIKPKDAVKLVGLNPVKPTSEASVKTEWKNIDGIYEFSVFTQNGKIDYMYTIVKELYK